MKVVNGDAPVKARDVEVGMVLRPLTSRKPCAVVKVERAVETLERLRVEVGAAGLSRVKVQALATDLLYVCNALECCGREARVVWFDGMRLPVSYPSADELRG